MGNAKKIFKNFLYFLTGEVAAKGIGFLALIYLARGLGADNFGKLGVAEAFLSYFIYIGAVGMDIVAVREVSRDRALAPRYLTNMTALKCVFAVIGYLLLFIFARFFIKSHEVLTLTLLYGLVLFSYALSTEWFFQSIEKMKYAGIYRVLREAGFAVLIFVFVGGAGELYYVPVARFTAMTAAAVFIIFLIYRKGYRADLRLDFKLWRYLAKESLPIVGSQMLILLIYNFPLIYLGLTRSNEEAGYYNAVYKVVLFFIGLASVFWYVIFPSLSRLTTESREKLRAFQEKVSWITASVAIPVGFIGSAAASPAMEFLYGPGYKPCGDIFRLLIWVGTAVMLNGIYAQGLLASNNQKLFMKTVMVQSAVSLILNVILIPRYGAEGAAAAWLSAEGVGLILYKYYYNRVINLSIAKYLPRPLTAGVAAAALMAVLSSYLNPGLFVQLSAGLAVYGAVLFALGGISAGGIRFVMNNFSAVKR